MRGAGTVPDRAERGAAHARPAPDVLASLGSTASGLSAAEAARRLREVGPNALRPPRGRSAARILADQFASFVVLLLVLAAAVAGLAGDVPEALAIGAVLLVNVSIGFSTELRARRALDALLRYETPRARVFRGGTLHVADARTLVPGDVIALEAGDTVPADARLLEGSELRTDETALTGESLPVDKRADDALADDTPLAERATMAYLGTSVVAGTARAVVVDTGDATELGRIGRLLGAMPDERTPLEKRIDALGRRLVVAAVAVGALVTTLGVLRGGALGPMLETGIALAIAAVPEGLPATITIALAVGVHRMARRRALTRRLPAVESLGAATLIGADKTGTLTAGSQTITEIVSGGETFTVSGTGLDPEGGFARDGAPVEPGSVESLRRLIVAGVTANDASLERAEGEWHVVGDPTDGAFLVLARKARIAPAADAPAGRVPFSSERRLSAVFLRREGRLEAYVKGAPGAILDRCSMVADASGHAVPVDDGTRSALRQANDELAGRGLRVIALADGNVHAAREADLRDLVFLGLAGMIDPPAEGVRETVATFRAAGIRTVMITGDQRRTAEAIGRDLGVIGPGETVMDGRDLARTPPEQLAARVEGVGAFSRVSAEDKVRLVEAYQSRGDIVAMLGDGVNDAAALRRADVGVAMGRRGTDIARQAAAVVLEDDRFPTIGAAIEEGRVIYDNVRKFVFYLFSCNLAEVAVLLFAGILALPLPLLPLQILWLNLVTDTFPALSLALEPAEPDVMKRPPRDPRQGILSRHMLRLVAAWALALSVVTLLAYLLTLQHGDVARARTVCFMTLALAQLFHLVNARSPSHVLGSRLLANRWALAAVALVIALQLAAVWLAPLARLLDLVPPRPVDWLWIIVLALLPAVAGQLLKWRSGDGHGASTVSTIEPSARP